MTSPIFAIQDMSTTAIANMGDADYRGGHAGFHFLESIRDAVVAFLSNGDYGIPDPDFGDYDFVTELTNEIMPTATFAIWQIFVDLEAWNEDLGDFGLSPMTEMTEMATEAIRQLAARIIRELLVLASQIHQGVSA